MLLKRLGSTITTVLLAGAAFAACGSDDAAVAVDGAWARASAPGQTSGAIYFDLTVDADDRLVGVSVPSAVAGGAEVHEVVIDGTALDDMPPDLMDDTMEMSMDEMATSAGSMDMADGETGAMRMQELADGLPLTAGDTVSFEPGSYHVMMPELAGPLEVGDVFELTLDFEHAEDVTVTVEVAETAP